MYDLYIDRVLPAIRDSLPLVARFVLAARPGYEDAVYSSLRGAAPILEYLSLELVDPEFTRQALPPPSDLFAESAPRLRSVYFQHITLPTAPLPVFSHVTSVDLHFLQQPPLQHIVANFPRAERLSMTCGENPVLSGDLPARFAEHIQYLKLWGLEGDYPSDICHAVAAQKIPFLEIEFGDYHRPVLCHFLHHPPVLLDCRIQTQSRYWTNIALEDSVAPDSDLKYRRLFRIDSSEPGDTTYVLDQLKCLQHTLTTIEIDHEHLQNFVMTFATLPVLHTFKIQLDRLAAPAKF